MENYIELIVAILVGLATAIPLVCALISYVKKAVKEKNWRQLLSLVMSLMTTAEKNFTDGATKKQWVLSMIEDSAEFLNYNISIEEVGNMIDKLCDMTKTINVDKKQTLDSEIIIEE